MLLPMRQANETPNHHPGSRERVRRGEFSSVDAGRKWRLLMHSDFLTITSIQLLWITIGTSFASFLNYIIIIVCGFFGSTKWSNYIATACKFIVTRRTLSSKFLDSDFIGSIRRVIRLFVGIIVRDGSAIPSPQNLCCTHRTASIDFLNSLLCCDGWYKNEQ